MLTPERVAAFHEDGFLNGGPVLSADEVAVLRAELDRVIADYDRLERRPVRMINLGAVEEAPVWQIVNIWEASEPFRDLLHRRAIVEDVAQLTGATALRLWHDQIQYKPPKEGGVNMWHQDAPLWPVLKPMTEVTAWVALDDADEENGCMSMVPGSHRWGNRLDFLGTLDAFDGLPAAFEGHPVEVVRCPVGSGEVHYHHALTWHGSPANRSARPRRAVALHYMTQDTRYDASGDHLLKPFITVADGAPMQGERFPLVWP
jgi:ectoine hydroxylase-related dioxygenase (phytanoyl-CoA dioxygenase family)